MIHLGTELSNRSSFRDGQLLRVPEYSKAYLPRPEYLLFFSGLWAASDAPRWELNLLDLGFYLFHLRSWLSRSLHQVNQNLILLGGTLLKLLRRLTQAWNGRVVALEGLGINIYG